MDIKFECAECGKRLEGMDSEALQVAMTALFAGKEFPKERDKVSTCIGALLTVILDNYVDSPSSHIRRELDSLFQAMRTDEEFGKSIGFVNKQAVMTVVRMIERLKRG